jgi:hypothetical protein
VAVICRLFVYQALVDLLTNADLSFIVDVHAECRRGANVLMSRSILTARRDLKNA